MASLPDVQQNQHGFYKTMIEKVGVRNIKVPFIVKRKDGTFSEVVATCSSYCNLNSDTKGINMSRISRSINKVLSRKKEGFDNLNDFVRELQKSHNTGEVWIKAKFTYFLEEKSPIEQLMSYEPVDVTFESRMKDNKIRTFLRVISKEMSLCPCSKEMSLLVNNLTQEENSELLLLSNNMSESLLRKIHMAGFGAHNQKSEIDVNVEVNLDNKLWIEDVIEICRRSASCSTFSTLKRADEKYLTEASYMGMYIDEHGVIIKTEDNDGPKFVEDIARDCSFTLNKLLDDKIYDYVVVVNNEESIHSQDIYATAIKTAGRNLK